MRGRRRYRSFARPRRRSFSRRRGRVGRSRRRSTMSRMLPRQQRVGRRM